MTEISANKNIKVLDPKFISEILKKINSELNSEDGIKATLIALKNNVSMKEKLIRIETDSDEKEIEMFMEIYAQNPKLKETVLNKLLKNILEIIKRLDDSINFLKSEIKIFEDKIFIELLNKYKDFFVNLFKTQLKIEEEENPEKTTNDKLIENYKNVESSNAFLLIFIEEASEKIKNLISKYKDLKKSFSLYFSSNDRSLMGKITIFFRECDDISIRIKEMLNNNSLEELS